MYIIKLIGLNLYKINVKLHCIFLESELVSGFMTEHAAVVFVFFFLAEYGSILLMCILISVLFLGGYLPSMFTLEFNSINNLIEVWSLKVEQLLYYNELYLNNVIRLSDLLEDHLYLYFAIHVYICNEILFTIYDIILFFIDSYLYLVAFLNTNESENFEILVLEGVFNGLIIGLKSSILVFIFIWIRASFPRIRFDQLMNFCWTILLPLIFAFIILIPCIMYCYNIFIINVNIF